MKENKDDINTSTIYNFPTVNEQCIVEIKGNEFDFFDDITIGKQTQNEYIYYILCGKAINNEYPNNNPSQLTSIISEKLYNYLVKFSKTINLDSYYNSGKRISENNFSFTKYITDKLNLILINKLIESNEFNLTLSISKKNIIDEDDKTIIKNYIEIKTTNEDLIEDKSNYYLGVNLIEISDELFDYLLIYKHDY